MLARLPDGRTVVHVAAEAGALKSLRVLGKAGADLNVVDQKGRTPLSVAIGMHFSTTVKALVDLGVNVNVEGAVEAEAPMPPLILAMRRGYSDIVTTLLDAKANMDQIASDGSTPLTAGAANGHAESVKFLLAHGAGVDAKNRDGDTPLILAVRHGSMDVVKVLLDAQADVNSRAPDGDTPLILAVRRGGVDLAKVLLDAKAGVDATSRDGDSALLLAVRRGDAAVAKVLLDAKADVNFLAPDGNTSLTAAAAAGHWNDVSLLLDRGANANAADSAGMTALLHAAIAGNVPAVEALLAKGADPQLTDKKNRAPLALTQSPTLWKMLVEKGADVNAQVQGATPLQHFIIDGNLALVKAWLAYKPDPMVPDRKGLTAKELARIQAGNAVMGDRREIARTLETYQNEYFAQLPNQ
jgi:ankyrin repeat protein